jgi:hypothetical protein
MVMGVEGTDAIIGSTLTFGLQTDYDQNRNYGLETVEMDVTSEHLQYVVGQRLDCCP